MTKKVIKVYWGNRKSKLGLKTYPKIELLRADFRFEPISKTGA